MYILYQKYWRVAVVLFAASFICACGGGGSETSPPSSTVTPEVVAPTSKPLSFVMTTQSLGLSHLWGLNNVAAQGIEIDSYHTAGGIAIGDYNQDGRVDLFVVGGNISPSKLYQLQADGRYLDVAGSAGVALMGTYSGPSFADTDNDGDLDLFVGGMGESPSKLFINQGDGTFVEGQGIKITKTYTVSSSFGDFNGDGWLDLALSHYGSEVSNDGEHLWLNLGNNQFKSVSQLSGTMNSRLDARNDGREHDVSFTPNFADIDGDGQLDLLMASDFYNSVYLHNVSGDYFVDQTDAIKLNKADLHGMGASVADVDNDGDLDWFVTNITLFQTQSGNLKYSGNKLLLNTGDNRFTDVSYQANIFNGGWGWATCIADFNNDGLLDLFNTNGWNQESDSSGSYESHHQDTITLFLATPSGRYQRVNTEVGLNHQGQGRGVVCFDQDNDGDIDILLFNHDVNQNALVFYQNQQTQGNYLKIQLSTELGNRFAIGARVWLTTENQTQLREVNLNSNFISQSPTELHFGLGQSTEASEIIILWPNGERQTLSRVSANQTLFIVQEK